MKVKNNTFVLLVLMLLFSFSIAVNSLSDATVLHIGDSHVAGSYGKQLHTLLTSQSNVVNTIGCSSASANHYTNGGFVCSPDAWTKLGGTTSGYSGENKYTLSNIETYLKQYNPDVVIVSLGTNFVSSPGSQSKDLVDKIFTVKPYITCYWVGPPNTEDPTIKNSLSSAVNTIKSQVSDRCTFIDSTQITDPQYLTDGKVHYNEQGGKLWAQNVFGKISSSSVSPQQPNQVTEQSLEYFDSMLLLGHNTDATRQARVNGACDLLRRGNFKKVVLSGGCTKEDVNSSNPCIIEAEDMHQKMLNSCPDALSAVKLYKESTSTSTVSNYQNSKRMFEQYEKILVVSSHEHVKPVEYCFRHDGYDAYYWQIGVSSVAKADVSRDVAKGIRSELVQSCDPQATGINNVPTSTGTNSGSNSNTHLSSIPYDGCASPYRCKEIDEAWSTRFASLIRGNNQAWNHVANKWDNWGVATKTSTGSSSGAGSITPGSGSVSTGTAGKLGGDNNQYDDIIVRAGTKNGVNPVLIKAFIEFESGFNPNEASGCSGLMQICGGSENSEYIKIMCDQPNDNPSLCDINNCNPYGKGSQWCKNCVGQSGCVSDDRFDPEKNIFSGTSTLKDKINGINNICNQLTCNDECKVKAQITSYNMGTLFVIDAIKRVGSCNNWETVWQELHNNCDFTTKTYTMQDGKKVYKSWLDEGKINRKRGSPGTGYTYNIYVNYQKYKQSGFSSGGSSPASSTSASGNSNNGLLLNVPFSSSPYEFSFVVLGDRYASGPGVNDGSFASILSKVVELQPDFVINVGDMSNAQSISNWKNQTFDFVNKYLLSNNIPYYPTFGNHDNYFYDWAWSDYLKNSGVDYKSAYNYAFSYGNSYFVSFNDFANHAAAKAGSDSPENVAKWLNEKLSSSSNAQHVFTFAHVPFEFTQGKDPQDQKEKNLPEYNAACDTFGPILKNKNNLISFTGHYHTFDYMTTTKDSCSGIKQFIVGSSGATQQRPSLNENYGFLLVNVNEDVVTVTKYELLDSDKNNPNGMFLEIKINI